MHIVIPLKLRSIKVNWLKTVQGHILLTKVYLILIINY